MNEIDPLNATASDFSRRAFVGLSAGAALYAGAGAQAIAQTKPLGAPHEPLVAENDPAITADWITLDRPDKKIRAYAAAPINAGPNTPGIVVVMHIWGVDTSIRDCVRRLAKEGYAVVAPDLFDRFSAPSGDGATDYKPFAEISAKLVDAQVDGDLQAGAQWLKTHHPHGKIGVTGICMGGGITLRQAVDSPIFSAAAVWYGKVRYATGGPPGNNEGPITRMALAYADEIRIPIAGNFGERDTGIRGDDVRALAKQLTVPHNIKVYAEAGHAFFDDQRESYVPSAAADAWTRTLAFFAKYLKGRSRTS
ncbi:MAG: dienelactone hydrolase family protein [Candidatus Eremiobacteraeota bacterium]|nr:dienelactone hydrolase family protein [Candidatus Eremiobacteraeota bacterium]